MKISLSQINPTVGDLRGNTEKIIKEIEKAKDLSSDLIVFPELSLIGYPPRDLIYNPDLARAVGKIINDVIAPTSYDIGIILGCPSYDGNSIYNSALFFYKGRLFFRQDKTLLPSYDVFDETRYFKPAKDISTISFRGLRLGITICEDIWNDKDYWNRRLYEADPVEKLISQGIDLIINISASPYYYKKCSLRLDMLTHIAKKYKKEIIYVNQVGGNDELIFDGSSLVVDKNGFILWRGKAFEEDFGTIDITQDTTSKETPDNIKEDISYIYRALVLGIRDYFAKTGFKKSFSSNKRGNRFFSSSMSGCFCARIRKCAWNQYAFKIFI
jgi:NAD+ synthase (glutamine-hydrolysing)